ncbi:hypothetical protein [Deinococcus cellulosilyticus]|uniref:Uncharacterized protein n=1 Tax=Deinococcus cellulosilyticus (strain DSM 18568 / NBRC 106333 / KACC 11606 / 5516J-15) TaxID=1223518 RepID=A0A511NB60_DEIC1|nr:hypothetical protein [Deinococcus cellulosilyticus]GEM50044.1 hypothetical protein DC3_56790 [Deinococcus cellulosilyticus NBRC 106333 = KACC 11606]
MAHPLQALFDLQEALRRKAVWRHDLDHHDPEDFRLPYPRFVAVVSDEVLFHQYLQESIELAAEYEERQITTRWFPTFFNETWENATVRVMEAYKPRVLHGEGTLPLMPVDEGKKDTYTESRLNELQELDCPYLTLRLAGKVSDGKYFPELVYHARKPVTVRVSTGRKFRLYARIVGGGNRNGVKVGAVVVRGLEGKVFEHLPRATRKDTKPLLIKILRYSFHGSAM